MPAGRDDGIGGRWDWPVNVHVVDETVDGVGRHARCTDPSAVADSASAIVSTTEQLTCAEGSDDRGPVRALDVDPGHDRPEILRAAQHCEQVGFDHVWVYDHLYGVNGDPYMTNFEGWTALAALAATTTFVRLGHLVLEDVPQPRARREDGRDRDHISGGRLILGVGAGWAEIEHRSYGFPFGSGFGERLDWMDEAVGAIRRLLDGESVTTEPGGTYRFEDLRLNPLPVQAHLPIMIGGTGEKKTLRSVARYADMWNLYRDRAEFQRLDGVLVAHCDAVGRDPAEIEPR